jgi:polygalacturonase
MNPRLIPVLAAALLSSQAWADPGDVAPAQPVIPAHAFNLRDYGAVGDGTTPDTAAIRRAIAAVRTAGGGMLEVPAGVFLTGPFSLCSKINLHLDEGAIIRFSPKGSDYPSGGRRLTQLTVASVHDVEISGSGKIDGHGDVWWAAANAARDPVRPGLPCSSSPTANASASRESA